MQNTAGESSSRTGQMLPELPSATHLGELLASDLSNSGWMLELLEGTFKTHRCPGLTQH